MRFDVLATKEDGTKFQSELIDTFEEAFLLSEEYLWDTCVITMYCYGFKSPINRYDLLRPQHYERK